MACLNGLFSNTGNSCSNGSCQNTNIDSSTLLFFFLILLLLFGSCNSSGNPNNLLFFFLLLALLFADEQGTGCSSCSNTNNSCGTC